MAAFVQANSGDWRTAATWVANSGYPGSADTVLLLTSKTVTLSHAEACKTLTTAGTNGITIATGGSLAISGGSGLVIGAGSALTLTGPGTITTDVFADDNTAAATIVFAGGLQLNAAGTIYSALSGTGSIVSGDGDITLAANAATGVSIDAGAADIGFQGGSADATVALTCAEVNISDAGSTWGTSGETLDQSGVANVIVSDGTITGNFTITDQWTITGGTLGVSGDTVRVASQPATFTDSDNALALAGDWYVSASIVVDASHNASQQYFANAVHLNPGTGWQVNDNAVVAAPARGPTRGIGVSFFPIRNP